MVVEVAGNGLCPVDEAGSTSRTRNVEVGSFCGVCHAPCMVRSPIDVRPRSTAAVGGTGTRWTLHTSEGSRESKV